MDRRILAVVAAGMVLSACGSLGIRDRSELVADSGVCAHHTLPVYFEESQAGLTSEAQTLIRTTADALRSCAIDRVRVVGLASATGGAQANQNLSERRAVNVAEALAGAGLPAPAFELEAVGEQGAREGGVSEPVRRRVEVIVEARPAG